MEIVEKQASRIPELAEVEEKVKADLIKEKKNEKAKRDAEALLAALKDGVAIETAGKAPVFLNAMAPYPTSALSAICPEWPLNFLMKAVCPRKLSRAARGFM